MSAVKLVLALLTGSLIGHSVLANVTTRANTISTFETHLRSSNYDIFSRPSSDVFPPIPTDIQVSVHLARTRSLSEDDSSWTVEFYLKQRWFDERLVNPTEKFGAIVDTRLADLIWSPTTYLADASVEAQVPGVYYNVTDDGWVTKTTRAEGVFPCTFNLTSHPNQFAICTLKITNFEDFGKHVSYTWDNGENSVTTKFGVLNMGAYKFSGQRLKFSGSSVEHPSTLTAEMVFERNVGLDCRLVLLPIVICVALALMALYVPADKVSCRFSLSVVSLIGGTAILMYYVDRVVKGGPITNVENFIYGCLIAIGLTVFDHFLVAIRALLRVTEEVTYVEASNTRSYLSQQQYRVIQKSPDQARLLQCTPEPKDSKCKRCRYASRRGCLFMVAVLDYLVRIATPVAFGAFLFCFCQQWCLNQNNQVLGLEQPVIKFESVITPAIL